MSDSGLERVLDLIIRRLERISDKNRVEKILDIKHWQLSEFLSDAARRDRRNSMFFSIITILYFPLGISVKQIGPGIYITESQHLIPLVLLVLAGFSTCVFFLKVIGTIKGVWVSSVVKGYLEPIDDVLNAYDIKTGGDIEKQTLKYLQENGLSNAYAHVNLYDALSIGSDLPQLSNGYFLKNDQLSRKQEFESEIKTRAHGEPEEYFKPLFRSNVRYHFASIPNLIELFAPWLLFLVALYFSLTS